MRAATVDAKTRWGSTLFRLDGRRRLERAFSRCLASGLAPLRELLGQGPVIFASNHVSFWDGFLLPQVERAVGAEAYCLMDRANLERLSFLRWAGALPVDCRDAKRGRLDLELAARVLDRPGRLLFVFPQGKQVPARMPLHFRSGILRLAECSGAPIVPAGLCYDFGQDAKPEVRLSIGAPVATEGSAKARLRQLEEAVRIELNRIDAAALAAPPDGNFAPLVNARPSGLPAGTRAISLLGSRRSA
jgi:1-acyl-sn-glycerol-3-phosphate acyltransferase